MLSNVAIGRQVNLFVIEEIISFSSSKYSICEIFKVLHIIMLGKNSRSGC
jgi:hypothetical protein